VATSANLSVTKVDTPDPVTAGGILTYTITVTNAGPSAAALVKLQDQQPTGTGFNSAIGPADWSCSGPEPFGEGTINCTPDSTSMGVGSVVITITLRISPSAPAGTVYTNTATVSSATADPSPGGESSTATTTVAAAAGLSLGIADAPDPVAVGSNLTYTLTVNNAGPSNAASATLSDPLPAGTTFVSLTAPGGWSCTTPAVGAGGTVSCTNASVPVASVMFTLVAKVGTSFAPGATITNTATLTSATDPPASLQTRTASATTTVVSPAFVTGTKSVTGQFVPGGAVTYTIVLSNSGPGTQADEPGPELSDVLSMELEQISATATSGTIAITDTPPTHTLTWDGSIPAGGTVTITIHATIGAGVPPGTSVANQGNIFYDSDGDGTHDSVSNTDDPAAPGPGPTFFTVGAPQSLNEIPALDDTGLALLMLLLALGGTALLWRRSAG
jgi:uncharacterized repeat protein (TIGR01451 family)